MIWRLPNSFRRESLSRQEKTEFRIVMVVESFRDVAAHGGVSCFGSFRDVMVYTMKSGDAGGGSLGNVVGSWLEMC